jgi:Amt family ammonium transporter
MLDTLGPFEDKPLDQTARQLLFICAILVFLMQVGFLLLETGSVQVRSMTGIAIKNFMMLLASSFAYYLIGHHLMWGESVVGIWGWSHEVPVDRKEWLFYQTGFAAVASTIVSGAIAGRTTLISNVVAAVFIAGLVYPVFGHWVWGQGWVNTQLNVHDFAGSAVVHFIGGIAALAGAVVTKPRSTWIIKIGDRMVEEKSVPLASAGVIFLWIGWMGFNGGSGGQNVGHFVLTTCSAATSGGFAALAMAALVRVVIHTKGPQPVPLSVAFKERWLFDPFALLSGAMGGMVAVTGVCDLLQSTRGGVFVGVCGGLATFFVGVVIKHAMEVDDPVDAIAVHAGAGVIGTVSPAFLLERISLWHQAVALAAGLLWTGIVMFPLFWLMKGPRIRDKGEDGDCFGGILRCSRIDEEEGLSFEPRVTLPPEFPLRTRYLSQDLKEDIKDVLLALVAGPIHRLEDIELEVDKLPPQRLRELLREQVKHLTLIGQFRLETQSLDLRALVDAVIDDFRFGEYSNVFFAIDPPAGPGQAMSAIGQRDLIQVAVRALVSNAARSARDHHVEDHQRAIVTCSFSSLGARTYLQVADNGSGVPRRVERRLFRPFNKREGQADGHGLGLFLAQFIASTYRGSVRLLRNERGVGATFQLSIPSR